MADHHESGAPLRIHLLARFRVVAADGRTVVDGSWRRSKARALLKLLALQPGHAMHRDRVIEALWPGRDPESGANNLHKNVYYVRNALGTADPPILLERDRVSLRGEMSTDVERFESLAAGARPDDAASMEEALAAYEGELLPEDPYEEWAEAPRERLRMRWRRLRLDLAKIYADSRRNQDAVRVVEPLALADPCDEEAHARLMRAHAAGGDRAAALRQYERLSTALRDELDVEPSSEIEELRASIAAAAQRAEEPVPPMPEVRYVTTSDGARIATMVLGEEHDGVPLVSMSTAPFSNLSYDWDWSVTRDFYDRMARHRRVIRYDARGYGLSDYENPDLSYEAQMLDLEAVMDAHVPDIADLLVWSNSAGCALPYIERYPGRIRRVIWWGAWADGPRWAAGFERPGLRLMLKEAWDTYRQTMARFLADFEDEGLSVHWAEWLDGSPKERIDDFWDICAASDVTELLPGLRHPVLGLTRDHRLTVERDLYFEAIALIPGARAEILPGNSYHFAVGDIETPLSLIDQFLDDPNISDLPPPMPEVRYTTAADGGRIAYMTLGDEHDGVPLVAMSCVPYSNLEYDWNWTATREFYSRLARNRRVIRYDAAGYGLSDTGDADISAESQIRSLQTVLDGLDVAQCDLLLWANCGPAGFPFLLRYPERIRRVICWSTWADGRAWGEMMDRAGFRQMLKTEWEMYRQTIVRYLLNFTDDATARRWADWMNGNTRERIDEFCELCGTTDNTHLLEQIRHPLLALVRKHAITAEVDLFRDAMAHVPEARVVTLPGGEYLQYLGDIETPLRLIDEFLDDPTIVDVVLSPTADEQAQA